MFPGLGLKYGGQIGKKKTQKSEKKAIKKRNSVKFGPSCFSPATMLQRTRLGNFRTFEFVQEPESFIVGYLIRSDRMGAWEQTATAVTA